MSMRAKYGVINIIYHLALKWHKHQCWC